MKHFFGAVAAIVVAVFLLNGVLAVSNKIVYSVEHPIATVESLLPKQTPTASKTHTETRGSDENGD